LGSLIKVDGWMTANDYIKILDDHLLSYLETLDQQNEYHFQDDNISIHQARKTLNWMSENNISHIS